LLGTHAHQFARGFEKAKHALNVHSRCPWSWLLDEQGMCTISHAALKLVTVEIDDPISTLNLHTAMLRHKRSLDVLRCPSQQANVSNRGFLIVLDTKQYTPSHWLHVCSDIQSLVLVNVRIGLVYAMIGLVAVGPSSFHRVTCISI